MKNAAANDKRRKPELAAIHMAKSQLNLTDDEYRDVMQFVTGKRSAAELDGAGRQLLLKHFEKSGFKGVKRFGKAPEVAPDRKARIGKIEALLADSSLPWAYADTLAKKICKKDALQFCEGDDLGKIIAALEKNARRVAGKKESEKR